MNAFRKDELYLKGRVQVETALTALAHTGINPVAQKRLQTFLDVHAVLSNGEDQNDLFIYLEDGSVEREKADILTSLDALTVADSIAPEARIAAGALRHIL